MHPEHKSKKQLIFYWELLITEIIRILSELILIITYISITAF